MRLTCRTSALCMHPKQTLAHEITYTRIRVTETQIHDVLTPFCTYISHTCPRPFDVHRPTYAYRCARRACPFGHPSEPRNPEPARRNIDQSTNTNQPNNHLIKVMRTVSTSQKASQVPSEQPESGIGFGGCGGGTWGDGRSKYSCMCHCLCLLMLYMSA